LDWWDIVDKKECTYYDKLYDVEDFVGGGFRVVAIFKEPCCCCEYRQELKGYIKINDKAIFGPVTEYQEDDPPYGHRLATENTDPDQYSCCFQLCDFERFVGCCYNMEDNPGYTPAKKKAKDLDKTLVIDIDLMLRLRIVDACNNDKVIDEKTLPIKCKVTVKPN
jgi:hypothetical protein